MRDTWQSGGAWIAIGWPQIFAIGRTIAITRSSSDGWRWARLSIKAHGIMQSWPFPHLKSIGRLWRIVEELRDRAAIAAWSSRDRGAIARLWTRNHLYMSRRWSAKTSNHDRSPIVTRSWLDRGTIVVLKSWEEEPNSPLNLVKIAARLKPRLMLKEEPPRRLKIATTTASTAHDSGPISPLKTHVLLLLFFNFWSTREEIKWVSRKISSSSCSPRV